MKHAARAVSLSVVLACVVGTMAVGAISKSSCAGGDYDGRQYRRLCYTDVVPLVGTEQFGGGRLPFLDTCRESDDNCDEYPVLTMYLMRVAAWIGGTGYVAFYWTNVVLLTGFALATATCLWMLAGRRALWFALAPTLAIYGVVNWDLAAVALATGALVAFASRRDALAGVLLGLGGATKLYPLFLLLPLFLQGVQDREPDRSVRVLWWTVGSWTAVNLPFAVLAPRGWIEFFRFNSERIADFDSLWYIACRHVDLACVSTNEVNLGAAVGFGVIVAVVWRLKAHRNPGFPRWTLGFPILVAFLLTNKVYSPQYGLWLLPWFALVGPDLRRFVAFEVADVAVFVTRFWFFGTLTGVMEVPQQWWFEVAVLARALILVWCLVGWVRTDPLPLALGTRGWRRPQRAPAVVEAGAG